MSCGTCDRISQRDAGTAPVWDSILRSDGWDVVHAYDTSLLSWIVLVPRMADLPDEHKGPGVFSYLSAEEERVSDTAMSELALRMRARLG